MRLLEPAPIRDGDAVLYRVPRPPGTRTACWLLGGICVVVFGGAVISLVVGQPAAFLGLLLVTALSVSATIFFLRLLLPPVLTTSQLLLPGAFGGWTAFELAELSGAGLRFVSPSSGKPSTWNLYVWYDDGTRRELPLGKPIGRLSGTTVYGVPVSVDERDTVWRRLADTPRGQMAVRIAEQALAVQGTDGLLARRRAERSAAPRADENAYWSPDGTMGALH